MTAAVMTERIAESSSRSTVARAGGFWWLMTIVAGIAAMVLGQKVNTTDLASLAANESIYRAGLVADLLATATYLAATVFVYVLLKAVSPNVSLLAAAFSIIGCAASTVAFAFRLAPLTLLQSAPEVARALLGVRVAGISFLFFGLHCLLVGVLIVRSTFLPRTVGMLMVLAGLGWLTFSLSRLLSPAFASHLSPWILMPGMIGEGSLSIWLLVKGVES